MKNVEPRREVLIAECRSSVDARKAVQAWIEQNRQIAARLGPNDVIVDLFRAEDGKNIFRCRALIPAEPLGNS